MKNYILGITSMVALVTIVGGAYYFGMQRTIPGLPEVSIIPSADNKGLPTAVPSSAPQAKPQVQVNVTEQIIAAITIKNTQPLQGYMADTVQVRLESSGCCGPITKAEAMSQLSYLDPAVGWDFDPANPILANLAVVAPEYYGAGWIVGVASNEYLVSFKLNSQNKIEAYNLAATYKLLTP